MTATLTAYDASALAKAVAKIAQCCSGPDAHFARSLTKVSPEAWGAAATREAYEMVARLGRHHKALGIDFAAIDRPPAGAERGRAALRAIEVEGDRFAIRYRYDPTLLGTLKLLPGGRYDPSLGCWTAPLAQAAAVAAWAEANRFVLSARAAEVVAATGSVAPKAGRITLDKVGQRPIAIAFEYRPHLTTAVREIPGRVWDGIERVWRCPTASIRAVRAFAEEHDFEVDPAVEALPDVEMFGTTGLSVRVVGGTFVLSFPYDAQLVDQVRELPDAEWSRDLWGWRVPLEAALEVVTLVESLKGHIEDSAMAALDRARAALAQLEASAAGDAELVVPEVVGTGAEPPWTLKPYQRAGVAYATKLAGGRCLIGDEPGLGKTSQALVSAELLGAFPLLVVPPASLKLNWVVETKTWLPHRSVAYVPSSSARQADLARIARRGVGIIRKPLDLARRDLFARRFDVVIVNYDALGRYLEVLKAYGFAGLVVDEAHYGKEGRSQRTKRLIEFSESLAADAARLLLTGTPVLSHGGELITQLQILGRLEEFGGVKKVKKALKNDPVGFNRRLRATCYVRRKKASVATELPPKSYAPVIVEGDPEVMKEYRRAEDNIVAYLADRAREAALAAGAADEEAEEAAWKTAIKAEAAQHLVAISALKKLAVAAKGPAVTEWITSFLETGKKLIVFGEHRDIVSDLADRFAGGRKLQGGMDDSTKERYKTEFQTEPDARVIVCNLKAGGVGHTLTAASDVLFVEHGWTPSDQDQPTDRAHRIGQRDNVTGWLMVTAGTIDEEIIALIANKRVVCDAVTDGDYTTLLDDPEARAEVTRLIATGLDPTEAGRQVAEELRKRSVLGELLVRLTEKGLEAA